MHYYISGYTRYSDLGKIRKELLRKPMPVPLPPLKWLWEQALFTMHCELKKGIAPLLAVSFFGIL